MAHRALYCGLLALAACSYKASSFDYWWSPFPGQRLTTDCLDLSVTRDDQGYTLGPVIGYTFGNRCDHRVAIDLGSVRVFALGVDGARTRLHAHDPRSEIRVTPVVALGDGQEFIEYRDTAGTPAARFGDICVDVAPLEPAANHGERLVCVGGPR